MLRGLETIGESAFGDCKNLEKITIPDSVIYISEYAFCGCTNLEITVPKSVKNICENAFKWCKKVTYLD